MAEKQIEDFGEKIGGARKDLYALNRELRMGDILDWSTIEREKYITKKEAFPLPDYQKMLEEGKDREVIFFVKKIRDALPTKPTVAVPYGASQEQKKQISEKAQNDYLITVNRFYEKVMALTSMQECIRFYREIRSENLPDQNCFGRKMIRAANLDGVYGMYRFRKELENKQFLYTEDEKILSKFSFYRFDGQNVRREQYENGKERLVIQQGGSSRYLYNADVDLAQWKEGMYFALNNSDNQIIAFNQTDEMAAKKEVLAREKENEPEKRADPVKRKKQLKPPQLQHIRPTAQDYRHGQDVSGDDMMESFGFRAGEFGNWNNVNDRQTNLNMSFDAFKDLAKALSIEDADIGLGGRLAIAYGARGKGGAVAHFEPGANVINLTKMRGAGSLAHEWGHAMDYYIARANGMDAGMATCPNAHNRRQGKEPFREVMQAIKYNGNEYSEFYKNAVTLDEHYSKTNQGYWRSDVELFARAFAAYVHDKLPDGTSDYLVGHADMTSDIVKDGKMIPVSPKGEEREKINREFDKAFEQFREQQIFRMRQQEVVKSLDAEVDNLLEEYHKNVKEPESKEVKREKTPKSTNKKFYTKEESEKMTEWLKEHISVVDVCQSLGFSPVRVGQRYYSLKEHDSVRLDLQKNCFYWNSTGEKGSVIDACIAFGSMDKAEAYNYLYEMAGGREAVYEATVGRRELSVSQEKAKEIQPLKEKMESASVELPPRDWNMRNVYAYLGKTRQISPDVIHEFVKKNMLYQDTRKNCVFVSRNEAGKPVFACKRGTNTHRRFVLDCPGNDYTKGFYVNNGADKLFVAESTIEIMSKMTILQKKGMDYHEYNYLAMAGTQKQDPIRNILESSPNIKEVDLGLNNDPGGLKAIGEIENALNGTELLVKRDMPERSGQDWNDVLCDMVIPDDENTMDPAESIYQSMEPEEQQIYDLALDYGDMEGAKKLIQEKQNQLERNRGVMEINWNQFPDQKVDPIVFPQLSKEGNFRQHIQEKMIGGFDR